MRSSLLKRVSWWRLGLSAVWLAPLAVGALPAQASGPIRVVGCNTASLSPALVASGIGVVAPNPDGSEAGSEDQVEEDQQPKIVGSIPKPRGVSEDDSKKLTPLVTVPQEQAIANALAAIANPAERRVRKALVEGENGFVVWAVKTERNDPNSGSDPRLEVKLDGGGNGDVLSIECEPDDD